MTADERLMLAQIQAMSAQLQAQNKTQADTTAAVLLQSQNLSSILAVNAAHAGEQGDDLVYAWQWILKQNGGNVPPGFKFPSDKVLPDISVSPATLGTPTKLETTT